MKKLFRCVEKHFQKLKIIFNCRLVVTLCATRRGSLVVAHIKSYLNRFMLTKITRVQSFIVAVITMIFNSFINRFNMLTKIVGCGSFVTAVFTLMFNAFMYTVQLSHVGGDYLS